MIDAMNSQMVQKKVCVCEYICIEKKRRHNKTNMENIKNLSRKIIHEFFLLFLQVFCEKNIPKKICKKYDNLPLGGKVSCYLKRQSGCKY